MLLILNMICPPEAVYSRPCRPGPDARSGSQSACLRLFSSYQGPFRLVILLNDPQISHQVSFLAATCEAGQMSTIGPAFITSLALIRHAYGRPGGACKAAAGRAGDMGVKGVRNRIELGVRMNDKTHFALSKLHSAWPQSIIKLRVHSLHTQQTTTQWRRVGEGPRPIASRTPRAGIL